MAIYTKSGSTNTTRYMLTDALGSTNVITTDTGEAEEYMSFFPFGEGRDGNDWSIPKATPSSITDHGFTGHLHLDALGIIHMQGRIYDYKLGRFLSADPYVQNPYDPQCLNRYSYCRNNPLRYVDPSGYGAVDDFCDAVCDAVSSAMDCFGLSDSEAEEAMNEINGCAGAGVGGQTWTIGNTPRLSEDQEMEQWCIEEKVDLRNLFGPSVPPEYRLDTRAWGDDDPRFKRIEWTVSGVLGYIYNGLTSDIKAMVVGNVTQVKDLTINAGITGGLAVGVVFGNTLNWGLSKVFGVTPRYISRSDIWNDNYGPKRFINSLCPRYGYFGGKGYPHDLENCIHNPMNGIDARYLEHDRGYLMKDYFGADYTASTMSRWDYSFSPYGQAYQLAATIAFGARSELKARGILDTY